MPKSMINRELSWLEFNQRVLELASDAMVPLLERIKFLGITSTNLDEFFMVRVSGLRDLAEGRHRQRDPAGLTPRQQLEAVSERARTLVAAQYRCFLNDLEPALGGAGILRLGHSALTDRQKEFVDAYFQETVYPVLTPMTLDPADPPLLANRRLYLAVRLRVPGSRGGTPSRGRGGEGVRTVLIPFGAALPRLVRLPADAGYVYTVLEDLVAAHIEHFFPGDEVLETAVLRLTRSASISVREDLAADLMAEMEEVLSARKRSRCVRLELQARASKTLRVYLQRLLDVDDLATYSIDGPLDLAAFADLSKIGGFETLRDPPWPPQPSPRITVGEAMFDVMRTGDLLLFHPQQSFDPVVRFIEEAAADPDVLAIKQILYRTSPRSPIVAALAAAAERGKSVTVIVELKARFDEARNIEWARALEESGVQVIYGIKGLKTHAKLCIVVRREPDGIRRYLHFGTGNYNEVTARLYTDTSLFTANPDLGADASAFFNTITGYSQPIRYRRLEQAPLGLRPMLLSLIEGEAERQRQGQKGLIMAKLNALVDPELIRALYAASQAGVEIHLNIRGICCLRPGVPGVSANIRVVSIVDRFLEHDRILYFRHGGDERVFISSADWMPRNLDRRIELLVPVDDPDCQRSLMKILRLRFADTTNAWALQPDGRYIRTPVTGATAVRSQEAIYALAEAELTAARQARPMVFEPHHAPETPA